MPFANNFTLPPGKAESLKDKRNGFSDPNGIFPKTEYERQSSVNEIARGFKRVNVELGGWIPESHLADKSKSAGPGCRTAMSSRRSPSLLHTLIIVRQ